MAENTICEIEDAIAASGNVGRNQLTAVSKTNRQLVPAAFLKMPPGFSIHSQTVTNAVMAKENDPPIAIPKHQDCWLRNFGMDTQSQPANPRVWDDRERARRAPPRSTRFKGALFVRGGRFQNGP